MKLPKTYQKGIYKDIILILCKKLLEKTPNIREMRPFWLLAKMASKQNHHFGSKNKIAYNISETNLQAYYTYSMQKTARKATNLW